MRKNDRYELIWRAIQKHGYKYDYRESKFNRLTDYIEIICPIHGKFKQRLLKHLKGRGCPKCGVDRVKNSLLLTLDEVKLKAKELYNIDYEIQCSNFQNNKSILKITCPLCHKTKIIRTDKFLSGRGCTCLTKNLNVHNIDTFQKKLDILHPNQFICLNYIDNQYDAIIKCLKCGEVFKRKPNIIYQALNCPYCKIKNNSVAKFHDFVKYVKKIYNNRYEYIEPKGKFINESNITVICPKHGEFKVMSQNHKQGNGCPKCFKNERLTLDKFKTMAKEIYGDTFIYDDVLYVNNKTHVTIQCAKCGLKFKVRPDIFLYKKCTICPNDNRSSLEILVQKALDEHNIEYISQYNDKWLGKLRIDFFLPKQQIAIECQGLQHFQPIEYFGGEKGFEKIINRDKRKKEICKRKNVKIIYFSNCDIKYPYEVITDINILINKIISYE